MPEGVDVDFSADHELGYEVELPSSDGCPSVESIAASEMVADRDRHVKMILESPSRKKLVVAGPGTGKTFLFGQVLGRRSGQGLVLTFINNLVRDLKEDLGPLAEVSTLHSFSKRLLHRLPVAGLSRDFDYYPRLLGLIAEDISAATGRPLTELRLREAYERLDECDGVIEEALARGSYYDAVSHCDSIYRAAKHLDDSHDAIPVYSVVIVDEFQDFNPLEIRLIQLLALTNPVVIAGDDDQALYDSKNASPRHIRELETGGVYEPFKLPYCSRCTEVLVKAVHLIIREAKRRGVLAARIDKPFMCYKPDKAKESEEYPRIRSVFCTVNTSQAPYVGRFVASQVRQIPADHFAEARERREPTVLVIGPAHFVRSVHRVLLDEGVDARLRRSQETGISCLDGYRRVAADQKSRLGWRILVHLAKPQGWEALVRDAFSGRELRECLSDAFVSNHNAIARVVGDLMVGKEVTGRQMAMVTQATGMSEGDLKGELLGAPLGEELEQGASPIEDIVCTTLVGAKGLSCQHAFVAGLNNEHFPRDPGAISEREVCQLIVALTRARKSCSLISCGRFGNKKLTESVFLEWLTPLLEPQRVDKTYFFGSLGG